MTATAAARRTPPARWAATGLYFLASIIGSRPAPALDPEIALHQYSARDGLVAGGISALSTDRQGNLWIGAYGGTLWRFREGTFTLHTDDGLAGKDAVVITEDGDGNLWIGTYGAGLFRLRDGLLFAFGPEDGLTSDLVWTLAEDAVMGSQSAPRIEIGAVRRRGAAENAEALCYVRDNGVGISPENRETVFGLFRQVDSEAEGSGMGLTLVKRIIEVHGGRIWVESEGDGCGSTFYLALPRANRP